MRMTGTVIALLLLSACAATGDQDGHRKHSPITDFIEVNELAEIDVIRTMDQLFSKEVDDRYVIISTRRQDYLLAYFSSCHKQLGGRVEPDVRRDSRALYSGIDTYRGCRIKALYPITKGQVVEIQEIAEAFGAN